jgi:hypothetical protein
MALSSVVVDHSFSTCRNSFKRQSYSTAVVSPTGNGLFSQFPQLDIVG